MNYSLKWNAKEETWIARVKHPTTGAWKPKWLPKTIRRKHQIDAEAWLHAWYHATYYPQGKPAEEKPKGDAAPIKGKKTLAVLAPRWLELRSRDNTRTKPNTFRGFQLSLANWIMDNPAKNLDGSPRFAHASIQNLDVEKELTINDVRGWILSLKGARSSRLQHISTLSSLLEDCAGEEWLSEDFVSPFLKAPIKKLVDDLHKKRKAEQFITALTSAQVGVLLTGHHYKVKAYRRMRYLAAVGTGLRDSEIQGLTFADLHLKDAVPYLRVERQLETIGVLPFKMYDTLIESGMNREQVAQVPNAVMTAPKYDSKRSIPLHPSVVAGLQWWQSEGWQKLTGKKPGKDDPVFPSEKAATKKAQIAFGFSDSAMLWKQDLTRLGLPLEQLDSQGMPHDLTFHSTRHTFSTLLEGAGVSEEQIGTLLGHGAKSTARSNYLGQNLGLFGELVGRLPLPLGAEIVKTARGSGSTTWGRVRFESAPPVP